RIFYSTFWELFIFLAVGTSGFVDDNRGDTVAVALLLRRWRFDERRVPSQSIRRVDQLYLLGRSEIPARSKRNGRPKDPHGERVGYCSLEIFPAFQPPKYTLSYSFEPPDLKYASVYVIVNKN